MSTSATSAVQQVSTASAVAHEVDKITAASSSLKTVFEVAQGVLDVAQTFAASVPAGVTSLNGVLGTTISAMNVVGLVNATKGLCFQDEKGKMVWERKDTTVENVFNVIGSATGATYYGVKVVQFLGDTAQLFNLGSAAPVLNLVGSVSLVVACGCDAGDNIRLLTTLPAKQVKIMDEITKYENMVDNAEALKAFAKKRFDQLSSKLAVLRKDSKSSSEKIAEVTTRKGYWELLSKDFGAASVVQVEQKELDSKNSATTTVDAKPAEAPKVNLAAKQLEILKQFCADKVAKANDKLANLDMKNTRTWMSIALDVIVIAIVVIGVILPFVGGSLLIAAVIVGLATSLMDLANIITRACLEYKKIVPVSLAGALELQPLVVQKAA